MRSYGTEPQVWRNGCEPCADGAHVWGEQIGVISQSHQDRLGNAVDPRTGNPAGGVRHGNAFIASNGNTCTRCGAWRGELGLEPTPELYVEHMTQIFREARRVLRDDGTLWLNLGDSYAGAGENRNGKNSNTLNNGKCDSPSRVANHGVRHELANGLKPKDLVGIPWRVAFALQADGWYLRQDIIWAKPNPMPESVRDRCTKAHEYIFLLSKSQKYYFDCDAIKEPFADERMGNPGGGGNYVKRVAETGFRNDGDTLGSGKWNEDGKHKGRNRRSVWTVTTKPFKGAHFATFPPQLIEPMVLAGCPKDGTVLDVFNGAGTTGLVALQHGRRYIGIELKEAYIDMTRERLKAQLQLAI